MVLFSISGLFALWETLARISDDGEKARGWGSIFVNGIFGPNVDTGSYATGSALFFSFIGILYFVLFLLVTIAVVRGAQGNSLKLSGIWAEFVSKWLWLKLIGTYILLILAIFIGFLMLILPGVILLWRLFLVPYIMVEQKGSIASAFRGSWNMTRGHAWAIYSVILVSILLGITNFFPIIGPLVAFALSSIYMVAPALRYEELKKQSS